MRPDIDTFRYPSSLRTTHAQQKFRTSFVHWAQGMHVPSVHSCFGEFQCLQGTGKARTKIPEKTRTPENNASESCNSSPEAAESDPALTRECRHGQTSEGKRPCVPPEVISPSSAEAPCPRSIRPSSSSHGSRHTGSGPSSNCSRHPGRIADTRPPLGLPFSDAQARPPVASGGDAAAEASGTPQPPDVVLDPVPELWLRSFAARLLSIVCKMIETGQTFDPGRWSKRQHMKSDQILAVRMRASFLEPAFRPKPGRN